jgi:hypothetical protein
MENFFFSRTGVLPVIKPQNRTSGRARRRPQATLQG